MKMPSNQDIEDTRRYIPWDSPEAEDMIERLMVAWQHVADRDARLKAWRIADKKLSKKEQK